MPGRETASAVAAAVAELAALADLHGSDKGNGVGLRHGYVRVYAAALAHLRGGPLKLLEIGLSVARDGGFCPSLAMWADWLPEAEIVGIDLDDYAAFRHPRCRTRIVDQTDRAAVLDLARAEGPFDVVVDDGAHLSDAQQTSFFALFPAVKPGGFYFVEDLHWRPPSEPADAIPTRSLFRAWSTGFRPEALARIARRQALPPAEIAARLAEIGHVQFFDSLAPDRPADQMADALLLVRKAL